MYKVLNFYMCVVNCTTNLKNSMTPFNFSLIEPFFEHYAILYGFNSYVLKSLQITLKPLK